MWVFAVKRGKEIENAAQKKRQAEGLKKYQRNLESQKPHKEAHEHKIQNLSRICLDNG